MTGTGPRPSGAARRDPNHRHRRDVATLPAESAVRDLQTVLSAAVARLRQTTGSASAVAWALRDDGRPYVAAASFVGEPPAEPDAAAFAAVAALPRATHGVGRDASPALRDLAARIRCIAAVRVTPGDGPALAALLIGGPEPPPDLRPRHLAALDAAARRLEGPLAAALAAGRLRRLDAEVRGLDRLASLGQLAAEIAHEVRNPLVSVKTFLQLLPERRDDPEFLTKFLEVASDELRRMERLLDVVIDHATPPRDQGPGASASVPEVLDSVAELLRHRALKRGVALQSARDPELPEVAIDDDALRQVVLNLALNAIDVSEAGGAVRLGAQAGDGDVTLTVSDAGPGIPEALRAAVFEPFYSTRGERPGGLGLAITRRIVEEAGGAIRVGAGPGGGAEFRVRLPARAPGVRRRGTPPLPG